MTGVVADTPELRADLALARKLGVSHRRFLGWEPVREIRNGRIYTEPEFDGWERALWRALDDWEATRCPGCGNALEESLWDPDTPKEQRPKWWAEYRQCRACEVLIIAQNLQHQRDEQTQKQAGEHAPPIPTRHRLWHVHRDDEKGW